MRNRQKNRKWFSIAMIFLLMLSLMLPQQAAFASEVSNTQGSNAVNDDVLEKAKEQAVENDKKAKKTSEQAKDSNKVPSLADEIDLKTEPKHDESEFVMNGKVEADIMKELDSEEKVNIIIRLKESIDMNKLSTSVAKLESDGDKATKVVKQLKSVANESQGDLLKQLKDLKSKGAVSNVQQFWVINGIAATVNENALEQIAKRQDVEKVTLDVVIKAPKLKVEETKPRLPEWGLEKINATKVWGQYGLQGEGIVVGIMDSGVQGDHEALRDNYRGRNGSGKYSWIDLSGQNYKTPTDGYGHGTHVAGTAVGGGDGEPIGVAPGAEWIAAKIFNDGGSTSASAIHAAFEWFLAPGGDPTKAPDVVNNSWGSSDPYRTEFLEDVRAWKAAGIFPLFAAGNDGPATQSIGSPGSYPESFAIGATDRYDQVASFSSRGPVYWQDENGENVRYVKPEVSAPGHEIYSSLPDGGYGVLSGTSMATPHVAGSIALLLDSNPDLTVDQISKLLEETAREEEHMGKLPNDDYGSGIVNIYQAVTEAAYAGEVQGKLTDAEGNPISGELYIPEEDLRIKVDDDGLFNFKLREGKHEVEINSFGYHSISDSISVEKGKVTEKTWALESSKRFTITGNVSFANGDPAAFAYVRVKDTPVELIRTNATGEYVIKDVPEDEYTLVVSGQGIKQKSKSVTVDKNVTVDIEVESVKIDSKKDWSTFKNNFARNAVTNAEVNAEELVSSWYYDTPGEVVFSSPVIAEGTVVFTTERGYVVALDQNTGEELWSISTGSSNRSTPTIVDGVVYVAGGADYSVHAIELKTGVMKWSTKLDYPAIYESPIYHDGILYVSSQMTNNAKAIALDAETGEVVWEQDVGNSVYFGAALGVDSLFVGAYESKELSALSLADGAERWKITIEGEGFASAPTYHDGVVYAATTNFEKGTGTLRAFDASNGEQLWKTGNIGNTEAGSPIIFDDIVIIGSAVNPVIKAFNKDTGELVWEAENGSTIVNSGSISGNGKLFVTDLSSNLKVYDAFSGERLYTYGLNSQSTAGVALSEGQVVVADYTGIHSFNSPGTLTGTVTDSKGEPVKAKISIVGTDQSVETDENGNYSLEAKPGKSTIKVASYGYKQITEELTIVSGYRVTKDYQLESAKTGSMSGMVVDEATGKAMENVTISVTDTPLEISTNENGKFNFSEVYEGTYDVFVTIPGYVDQKVPVTVKVGEETSKTFKLKAIQVAVLDDYDGEIVRFLNNNNISAEELEWDTIVDEVGSYEVLYMNGAYTSAGPDPTKQAFENLVAAAKENDVSVVFADTWGPSYGSIRSLWEFEKDPVKFDAYTSNYANVHLRIDEKEHPIFKGIDAETSQTIINKGYLAWFNQYSGRNLATVGSSTEGFQGSGVAYKGVTENSAHLLLSTHAASPWVSPYNGWTSTQQKIFLNGVNYLLEDASFGKISGTVKDTEGKPLKNVTVEVKDTGVTTTSDSSGVYEMFHDEGSFQVSFHKTGYSKQEVAVEFKNGQPVIKDIVMTTSKSGTISGQVIDKVTGQAVPYAEIVLYNEAGDVVTNVVSSVNGNYELTGLDEATYKLEIVLRDFVTHTETIQVASEPITKNIELYPAPNVAIVGDYSFDSLVDLLDAKGITATDYNGLEDVKPELPNLDVVFFDDQSTISVTKKVLEDFMAEADKNQVSVIFGDDYWSGSGINHLVENFKDPELRTQRRDKTTQAGYVVLEENPIFGDAKKGEFIDILVPEASSVASFEGYSGYPLATIKHESHEEAHGLGVAYKPRTAGSMELLMSGHGMSFTHNAEDYTQNGLDIFVNAILWASYIEYNTIDGKVTDEAGNPIYANVELKGQGIDQWTNPETGAFSIGSIDGEFEIEVSAFGYQTVTKTVTVDENLESLTIQMALQEDVGSIEGTLVDENTLEGVEGAHINIVNYPREATADISGDFAIANMEPGTYTLVITKDGYVEQELEVEVKANEATIIERDMKPSPTIGVIVDSDSDTTLKGYLTPKGYNVKDIFYTDLDRIKDMDLIFANSDYDNDLIPEAEVFKNFVKELDRTETPVIWTGNEGPRGSIRYLVEYMGNPKTENAGRLSSSENTMTATKVKDHPLLEGVKFDENDAFTYHSNYYNGFEGYTGTTVATASHPTVGELGSLVAYGGRTINSVEVLLSSMTFGYGFTNSDENFDENRKRIVDNAILWALDNEKPLVGEIHGKVTNESELDVYSTVTVEETGYTLKTEQDGTFFLGLPDGTYNLKIDAFGHHSQSFEVVVENGKQVEKNFVLGSENAGKIKGQVKGDDNGQGIAEATIELVGTPIQTKTDEKGSYELQAPAGDYQVRVTASGYSPEVVDVQVVHNEEVSLNFNLTISEKIAYVGRAYDKESIMPFLEENGYDAAYFTEKEIDQLMSSIDEYALVILNDRDKATMTDDKFNAFVDETDEKGISVIFTSQWKSGTIEDLSDIYGDPESETSDFVPNHINYTVLENHPLLAGFEKGDVITIVDREKYSQQYSSFEGYSGTTIADITHEEEGNLGGGLAYDFRTANNVHILLGGLHVGSYGTPDERWTNDAKQIFINAIDWGISASLGEINGVVKDKEGNAISGATVSTTNGVTTQTNAKGSYVLGIGVGEHEVKVQARGYAPQTQNVKITELGQKVKLDFTMERTDRMSLSGVITDVDGNGIQGASITLTEKSGAYEQTVKTNEEGSYQFDQLVAGEYEFFIEANGYQTVKQDVTIKEGESTELNLKLSEFNIAVLGDIKDNITTFFNENEFAAQSREWDIVDDVYNYELIVVNSSDGTAEQVKKLIDEADKNETSLVFTDTWGNDGSIPLLEEAYGSPAQAQQSYNEGPVFVKAQNDHEIFANLGEKNIKVHSEKSPYATFKNYEGKTLANLIVDGKDKGSTIAYDYRGKNHMHLLLSSYTVNNMIGPNKGWTEQGKQLFLQAVKWAKDGVQELPSKPEWTVDERIITDGEFELTGKADYRSKVSILHGEKVIATATPDKDNTFSTTVSDLADGEYELTLQSSNFAGDVTAEKSITVIVDSESPKLQVTSPTEDMVIGREVVEVNGTVTDNNLDRLLVNKEKVEVNENGQFATKVIVNPGSNSVVIEAHDLAGNVTTVERIVTVKTDAPVITKLKPDSDQYVNPGDEIEVSFTSESEGGKAGFTVQLPTQLSGKTSTVNEMKEVEPGVYQGTWKVPTGVDLLGAVIVIEFTDGAGNSVTKEAKGKLFINESQVDRIEGPNRYETAIKISQKGWSSADTVVLARSDEYADALAGVPLAYKLDAPILLTRTDGLFDFTVEEIKRLKAKNVVILGGNDAIGKVVERKLENEGLNVRRLAGATRSETAALIASEVSPNGTNKAVVVNGLDFPDAMSVAAHAARNELPILLTRTDRILEATTEALTKLGVKETIVVGGPVVVSDKVKRQLPKAERISGANRYATNIEVAKSFDVDNKSLYVATGRTYADALTGAVLAAKEDSTIVFVKDFVPEVVSTFLQNNGTEHLTIFGGDAVVSRDVAKALEKLIK